MEGGGGGGGWRRAGGGGGGEKEGSDRGQAVSERILLLEHRGQQDGHFMQ